MSQIPPPPPPTPPTPPGEGFTSGVGRPADVIIRFIARLIDAVLLAIASFVLAFALSPVLPGRAGTFGFFSTGGFFLRNLILAVISAAIYIAYFAFLESSRGQTIGKMIVKLQVQGPDGAKPSLEAALKRNAWLALSIVPALGGLLQFAAAAYIGYTIYDSASNTGWHDQFAGGTQVIRIG